MPESTPCRILRQEEEFSHAEPEADRYALPGKVGEHPFVVAVNPMGELTTVRAGNLLGAGANGKDNNAVLGSDGFEGQGGGVRQQRRVR